MAENLQPKLIDYLQDAYGMEVNSLQMLKGMLIHTSDPEMRTLIEQHINETENHQASLGGRLNELGEKPSGIRKTTALFSAAMKGLIDQIRSDKPGKDARDAYVTEQVEIAAYELLLRLAERAGDGQTATIARGNLAEEKAMAQKLSGTWDKVIDLTLLEERARV